MAGFWACRSRQSYHSGDNNPNKPDTLLLSSCTVLNFTAFSISLIMKIAYLTTCFGTQSHTFIRREIRALRGLGLDLTLYGIRKDSNNLASDAADLVAQTCYLYPLSWAYTLKCNAKSLRRSPVHYLRSI